jgi:hypothetical protein
MARLFTINFTYNDVPFTTIVTVQTTPFYMEYTLANLDSELLLLLPGNKIISPSSKNFLFPNASPEHSTELMNSIIKAVAQHMEAVNS